MNIRQMVRKALLKEGRHAISNDYGCVMVFLKVKSKDWESIQNIIDEDDLYLGDKDESGFGRESDPHITILFGIHADVPDADVESFIDEIKTPIIKLKKSSSFTNEKFDVLKFDIESEDLHKLNEKFKKLPHTDTFPEYHPHATIAYLKKGKAAKYIKIINDMKLIDVKPDKIVYSKVDGSKKEYKLK